MSTVRDLIKGSLRLIGAISTGETPSADEQADALVALNDMLDSWSTENLIIQSKVREEFTLVSGTQSYTIGSGGTFNTSRPLKIEAATIEDQSSSPNSEYNLEIINLEQWASIPIKDVAGVSIPTRLYFEDTYPLATIYLWPKPSAANKLVLYSWKPLTSFASVDTVLSVAPGYAKAFRYNLALDLAPEYGKEPSQFVLDGANKSKSNIKRMNIKPHYLKSDPAVLSGSPFNILTGE